MGLDEKKPEIKPATDIKTGWDWFNDSEEPGSDWHEGVDFSRTAPETLGKPIAAGKYWGGFGVTGHKKFDPVYWEQIQRDYYWEDPMRVARYYNLLNNAAPGTQLPDWLEQNREPLTTAYKYMQEKNDNAPFWQWKRLHPEDPGHGYMSRIPTPPMESMFPSEQEQFMKYQGRDIYLPPGAREQWDEYQAEQAEYDAPDQTTFDDLPDEETVSITAEQYNISSWDDLTEADIKIIAGAYDLTDDQVASLQTGTFEVTMGQIRAYKPNYDMASGQQAAAEGKLGLGHQILLFLGSSGTRQLAPKLAPSLTVEDVFGDVQAGTISGVAGATETLLRTGSLGAAGSQLISGYALGSTLSRLSQAGLVKGEDDQPLLDADGNIQWKGGIHAVLRGGSTLISNFFLWGAESIEIALGTTAVAAQFARYKATGDMGGYEEGTMRQLQGIYSDVTDLSNLSQSYKALKDLGTATRLFYETSEDPRRRAEALGGDLSGEAYERYQNMLSGHGQIREGDLKLLEGLGVLPGDLSGTKLVQQSGDPNWYEQPGFLAAVADGYDLVHNSENPIGFDELQYAIGGKYGITGQEDNLKWQLILDFWNLTGPGKAGMVVLEGVARTFGASNLANAAKYSYGVKDFSALYKAEIERNVRTEDYKNFNLVQQRIVGVTADGTSKLLQGIKVEDVRVEGVELSKKSMKKLKEFGYDPDFIDKVTMEEATRIVKDKVTADEYVTPVSHYIKPPGMVDRIVGTMVGTGVPLVMWGVGVNPALGVMLAAMQLSDPNTRGGWNIGFTGMFNMTPESRVRYMLMRGQDNLAHVLEFATKDGVFDVDTAVELVRSVSKSPQILADKLSIGFLHSPEAQLFPIALRDQMVKVDDLHVAYKATAWKRGMLLNLAKTMLKSPTQLLMMLKSADDAEILLKQYVTKAETYLKTGETPKADIGRPELEILEKAIKTKDQATIDLFEKLIGIKANDLIRLMKAEPAKVVEADLEAAQSIVDAYKSGELTAAKLNEMVQVFYEDGIAFNDDYFKGQMYALLATEMEAWGVQYYGIEPDPAVRQMQGLVKSAQSLLLLGLNPNYFINNAINNIVSLGAEGSLGVMNATAIGEYWDKNGSRPAKLWSGYGPAGSPEITLEQVQKAKRIGSPQQSGYMLQKAQDGMRKISDKLGFFSKKSKIFESGSSALGYTVAHKRIMNKLWGTGDNFDIMPETLKQGLGSINPELPAFIDGLIKQSRNHGELDAVMDAEGMKTSSALFEQVAQQLGMDVEQVRDIWNETGLDMMFETLLSRDPSADDIHNAFTKVEDKLIDVQERRMVDSLVNEATKAFEGTKGEGVQKVVEIFGRLGLRKTVALLTTRADWIQAYEDAGKVKNQSTKNAIFGRIRERQRGKWNRYNKWEKASYSGILKALGSSSELGRRVSNSLLEIHKGWDDFYRLQETIIQGKFSGDDARSWTDVWKEIDDNILRAYDNEKIYQLEMDTAVTKIFGVQFGEAGAEAARAWLSTLRDTRSEIRLGWDETYAKSREGTLEVPARQIVSEFINGDLRQLYLKRLEQYVHGSRAVYEIASGEKTVAEIEQLIGLAGERYGTEAPHKMLTLDQAEIDRMFGETDYNPPDGLYVEPGDSVERALVRKAAAAAGFFTAYKADLKDAGWQKGDYILGTDTYLLDVIRKYAPDHENIVDLAQVRDPEKVVGKAISDHIKAGEERIRVAEIEKANQYRMDFDLKEPEEYHTKLNELGYEPAEYGDISPRDMDTIVKHEWEPAQYEKYVEDRAVKKVEALDQLEVIKKKPPKEVRKVQKRVPVGDVDFGVTGKSGTMLSADVQTQYQYAYTLVPLSRVIASHNIDLTENKQFPWDMDIQDRIRDEGQAVIQINSIIQKFNEVAYLVESPYTNMGTPIIDDTGVIISGNGRTIALRRIALDHLESWTRYQDLLIKELDTFGFKEGDLEGIENPILVRRLVGETDIKQLANDANTAAVLERSPKEMAISDAKNMSQEAVANFSVLSSMTIEQSLKSKENRSFLQKFMENVPENERAGLFDADGEPTKKLIDRVKHGMFAYAYGENLGTRLLEELTQSLDGIGSRNIENALYDTLSYVTKMEGGVKTGRIAPDLRITEDIALMLHERNRMLSSEMYRRHGIDSYFGQTTFGDAVPTHVEGLIRYLEGLKPTEWRKAMRDFIVEYSKAVFETPPINQEGMFEGARSTKEEVIQNAIRHSDPDAGRYFTDLEPGADAARTTKQSAELEEPQPGRDPAAGREGVQEQPVDAASIAKEVRKHPEQFDLQDVVRAIEGVEPHLANDALESKLKNIVQEGAKIQSKSEDFEAYITDWVDKTEARGLAKRALVDFAGLTDAVADDVMVIYDGIATWYARNHEGKTANDFYAERIFGWTRGEDTPIPGMDDALKQAKLEFPDMDVDAAGATHLVLDSFTGEARAIVTFFEKSNVSTALHEIMHVAEDLMPVSDQSIIRAEYGLKENEWLDKLGDDGRPMSERFAEEFEKYLESNKAPTPELRTVFQRLAGLLKTIYHSLSSVMKRNVSPEMRELFDRMVAGDDYEPIKDLEPKPDDPEVQTDMFAEGAEDLPIFSGTLPRANESVFKKETVSRTEFMEGFEDTFKKPEPKLDDADYEGFMAEGEEPGPRLQLSTDAAKEAEKLLPGTPLSDKLEMSWRETAYIGRDGNRLSGNVHGIEGTRMSHDYFASEYGAKHDIPRITVAEHLSDTGWIRVNYMDHDRGVAYFDIYNKPTRKMVSEMLSIVGVVDDVTFDFHIQETPTSDWKGGSVKYNYKDFGNLETEVRKYIDYIYNRGIDPNQVSVLDRSDIRWQLDSREWFNSEEGKKRIVDSDGKRVWFQNADGTIGNMEIDGEVPQGAGLPLGSTDTYDQAAPLHLMMEEGLDETIMPIVDGMRNAMLGEEGRRYRVGGDALPNTVSRELQQYLAKLKGQMSDTKLFALKYAEHKRDAALVDYGKRYYADQMIEGIIPYWLWYGRNAFQWATRAIDRPGWYATHAKLRNTQKNIQNLPGFPRRLEGKFRVNAPFLPEWMGDTMFFDPMHQIFPFEQFMYPANKFLEDKDLENKRVRQVLLGWVGDGKITIEQARSANESKDDLWEQARAQSDMDFDQERGSIFDYVSLMFQPSMPIDITGKLLEGKGKEISQTPVTRLIQSLTGTFMSNTIPGGWAGPEGYIRELFGSPARGYLFEYYVARELSNMIADDPELGVEDTKLAMINKTGPLYEEAVRRAGYYTGSRYLGAPFWIDFLPTGEQTMRELQQEFNEVFETGDGEAIGKMFDEHPEYEARLQLRDWEDPQAMLRAYMIDSIWSGWFDLQKLERQAMSDQLGEDFGTLFLDSETRSYDAISDPLLTQWAKAFGGRMPDDVVDVNELKLDMPDQETSGAYQRYLEQKQQDYPDASILQEMMYSMPENARDAFAKQVGLDEYWKFKNSELAKTPELIPHMIGELNELYWAPPEIQKAVYQYRAKRDELYPNIFDLWDKYFMIPENQKENKRNFYDANLSEYVEWQKRFLARNPKLIPYLKSEKQLAEAVLGEEYLLPAELLDFETMDPALAGQLIAYILYGNKLGPGAMTALYRQWEEQGKPYGDFENYLAQLREITELPALQ